MCLPLWRLDASYHLSDANAETGGAANQRAQWASHLEPDGRPVRADGRGQRVKGLGGGLAGRLTQLLASRLLAGGSGGTSVYAAVQIAKRLGSGKRVLMGDPGRNYLPAAGLSEVARYQVPTSLDLEDRITRETIVWLWDAGG